MTTVPLNAECNIVCPSTTCATPFDRVTVSWTIRNGCRVAWELRPEFIDPMPYQFTLQVGQSAAPDADDWVDVGASVENIYFAVDGEQRIWGNSVDRFQFYRVKLETPVGTYYSDPTGLLGILGVADWKLARERVRRELIRMRVLPGGQLGYLLKKRISGQRCPVCLDPLTNEIRNPNCPTCWGTGFYCGYFFPIACVWADISPKTTRIKIDGSRGTVNDVVVSARMVNAWMLSEDDIFVVKQTDDRYYVHTVQNLVEQRGIPLVSQVELRPAVVTDIAYAIPIPDQLADEEG